MCLKIILTFPSYGSIAEISIMMFGIKKEFGSSETESSKMKLIAETKLCGVYIFSCYAAEFILMVKRLASDVSPYNPNNSYHRF